MVGSYQRLEERKTSVSVILLNTVNAFSASLNEHTISFADKFMMTI